MDLSKYDPLVDLTPWYRTSLHGTPHREGYYATSQVGGTSKLVVETYFDPDKPWTAAYWIGMTAEGHMKALAKQMDLTGPPKTPRVRLIEQMQLPLSSRVALQV